MFIGGKLGGTETFRSVYSTYTKDTVMEKEKGEKRNKNTEVNWQKVKENDKWNKFVQEKRQYKIQKKAQE